MENNIIEIPISKDKPDLSEDFTTYLEVRDKGFNSKMPCNLHFFEWSDINQEKTFDDHTVFIRWLTQCRIYSKWDEDKRIKELAHTKNGAWIICKTGTKDLVIENSLDEMVKVFNGEAESKPTPSTATTPASTTPPRSQFPMSPVAPCYSFGGGRTLLDDYDDLYD